MVQTNDPEPVWDKPVDVPEKWIQTVDDNVFASKSFLCDRESTKAQNVTKAELPPGSQVKGIFPYGASYWTRTAEIQTEQADGAPLSFFLKVTQHETGKAMVSGEFVSMKSLHDTLPHLTPIPFAWGTYAADPNVHFFLCGFVDMADDLPDVQALAASLADLHMKGLSPNGKYGFSVPTLQGTIPQYTAWTDTWEEFFSNSIKLVMKNEENSQGPDPELQRLCEAILTKVIPRLLRPLETGGRRIQPRLVHGDIWDGNVSTDVATNTPVIFDATCIYAHNESMSFTVACSTHSNRGS